MQKQVKFLNSVCRFEKPEDTYVLFAVARRKNNEFLTNSQEVVLRQIVKQSSDIEKKWKKLVEEAKDYEYNGIKLNFYYYVSANARDAHKAWFVFQTKMNNYVEQLHTSNDKPSILKQLKRVDKHYLTCLMKPVCKNSKRFLLDVDTKDEEQLAVISKTLWENNITLLTANETKNGHHLLVRPFDRRIFKDIKDVEVKPDGLMFIDYTEEGKELK